MWAVSCTLPALLRLGRTFKIFFKAFMIFSFTIRNLDFLTNFGSSAGAYEEGL